MWYPESEPWQYRVLDAMPRGSVDRAQLEAALKMSPTERVLAAMRLNEMVAEIQRAKR